MKSFKALVLIALIIVIGGAAALYGASYLENGSSESTEEVVVSDNEEEVIEPDIEQAQLEPGSYFIFENHAYVSEYDYDLGGYDELYEYYRVSTDGEVELVAAVDHGKEISGALTARVFGQNLLLQRYEDENQEARMNLNGEVVEINEWIDGNNTIASANGRYEVHSPTVYRDGGDHSQEIIVIDTQQQGEIARFTRDDFEEGLVWGLYPIQIDNNGEILNVYAHCGGCEGAFADQWSVNVKTREIVKISELVGAQDFNLTSINMDTRQMLSIAQTHEWSTEGPYQELLPPAAFEILDLDTQEVETLFVDETHGWDRPVMDPAGAYRFVVRKWQEGTAFYLVSTQDGEITEDMYLTDGWVNDWLGNTILLDGYMETPRLLNVDTKEEMMIEFPNAEDIRYIGSITIE